MRILFAAPDRDLLECYKKIMEQDIGETVAVFDATGLLFTIASEKFDIAVMDIDLPRADHKTLIRRMRGMGIPVILLTKDPVSLSQLKEDVLPNEYLQYPFDAAKLTGIIKKTHERAVSGKCLDAAGLKIDVAGFRIKDGAGLTGRELDLLLLLLKGEEVTAGNENDMTAIHALNEKLARAGGAARINYMAGKGFKLVNEDE